MTAIVEANRRRYAARVGGGLGFCLQMFTYWTEHLCPAEPWSGTGDTRAPKTARGRRRALLEVVACAARGDDDATHGAFVRDEPFANARLRLPAKFKGGGLRSLADNAEAAFAKP